MGPFFYLTMKQQTIVKLTLKNLNTSIVEFKQAQKFDQYGPGSKSILQITDINRHTKPRHHVPPCSFYSFAISKHMF